MLPGPSAFFFFFLDFAYVPSLSAARVAGTFLLQDSAAIAKTRLLLPRHCISAALVRFRGNNA